MKGCATLFLSLILSASCAYAIEESLVPARIIPDKPCFVKGEVIRAGFENIQGTGVWIGLYPKKNLNNFDTLPKFIEGRLSDWVLSCDRKDKCDEWPTNGNIGFDTDELDYGEYVVAVSGDRANLNSQARSQSFIVDAHCPKRHDWMPARAGDQRSPCPFVNTVANHGFINRNGTNIDVFHMADQLEAVYNVAADFLRQGPIQQMIDCNQTYEDENGVLRFDLDILFDDNCEEHEASMVRADKFFGFEKSKKVDDTLLNNLLRRNPGESVLRFDDVMDYQAERIMTSRLINPETEFRHFDVGNMGAQGMFLFLLSSDSSMMTVEKNRLYFFLLDEKLPDDFIPGSLRDTPFNPKDVTDFVHDRLMFSMLNVESMMHVPIDAAFRNTHDHLLGDHHRNGAHALHGHHENQ